MEFEPVSSFDLNIRGLNVSYKKSSEEIIFGKSTLNAPAVDGKVKLRILLDRGTIELFANEGAAVSTNYVVPEANNNSVSFSADGELKINSISINELKSSWPASK